MIRTLVVAAGLAVGASAAQAAVTGVRIIEGDSAAASAALGQAATVLRIFAEFDGPGQIAGLPNNAANHVLSMTRVDFSVKQPGTSFSQQTDNFGLGLGGVIAPTVGALNPAFGNVRWDSYGSLGYDPDEGVEDPRRASISLEPGTSESTTAYVGGIFNAEANNGVGVARTNAGNPFSANSVFLWQLVILGTQGDGSFNSFAVSPGEGSATVVDGIPEVEIALNAGGLLQGGFSFGTRSSPVPFLFNVTFTQGDDPVIPTPGAIALFGLAGLSAARRRR